MSIDHTSHRVSSMRLGRRSVLAGIIGVGTVAMLPREALAAPVQQQTAIALAGSSAQPMKASAEAPIPPALRSRQALLGATPRAALDTLPLTQNGTTYNLAQEVRWLDDEHFAVGRWDGTMSIFSFDTAPFVGPQVTAAVNTPSSQGVQMITPLPGNTIVTSNDSSSISVWGTPNGNWDQFTHRRMVTYDPSLGVATNAAWFPVGDPSTLVVGHDSGMLTLWSYLPSSGSLRLITTVDVRNPSPVNPFGSHVVYGICSLIQSGPHATVVAGSDDGYVSVVRVPSGTVVSQTVFNPAAQRGINSVSALGNKLLVANCSVGADDHNLWYFAVNASSGELTLLDSMNLIIDAQEIQSFNFCTIWGRYSGGPCWFAGTEEGALWMGTADTTLHLLGHEGLGDGAIGAALDYTDGPGRLAAVIHNLDQFTTGAA